MAKLKRIVKFLDEYLNIDEIEDNSWNGLQIEGNPVVEKALFAVDAGMETFTTAVGENADLIVVHHGHFWKNLNPSVTEWAKERIEILYEHKISLYACHLPLDKHREIGNNAQLLRLLGARIKEEFGEYQGTCIGWIGEFKPPLSVKMIEKKLNSQLKAECTVLPFGKKRVKTIATCSGGGGLRIFFEALNKRVDLYLTGDSTEIYHTAKDAHFNVIFAGHHATETLGVKTLCEIVRQKTKIETLFVDIPTEL